MKKKLSRIIHAVLLVAFLVVVGLLMRDASDTFRARAYDAAAPTPAKFARLWRMIPADADFDLTLDVPRALANPLLRERLGRIAGGQNGIAAELVEALLEHQNTVGLLSLAGTVGAAGDAPHLVILAQGAFDEQALLAAVRTALAAGHAGIVATPLGWTTLYAESDARDPFGFLLLDGEHLAVGLQSALTAFYSTPPKPAPASPRATEAVIFGHLRMGPRVAALLPPAIEAPEGVDIAGSEDGRIAAMLTCRDAQRAQDLTMFLEGVRSLLLLQQEQHLALTSLLKGISVSGDGAHVTLASALFPLLDLWVQPPGEEATPAQ